MEAKLKALRVADLRDILQKASVAIPAKSNKSDLIAKILATPAALETFNNQSSSIAVSASKLKAPESSHGGQDDDLLAPPEEFDWGSASAPNGGPATSVPTGEGATTAPTKPIGTKPAVSTAQSQPEKPATTQPGLSSAPTAPTSVSQDEELERRKKRAARFNIPLVEVKKPITPASNGPKAKASPKSQALPSEEVAKLEARASRFGLPKSSPTKSSATNAQATAQKRARSPAPADKEEMERRRKRAERFSTGETKA